MSQGAVLRPASGVVLLGGQSRRFGRDKALELLNGTPLALHVIRALQTCCDEVFAVGGSLPQHEALGIPMVPDQRPGLGPLGGIVSALEHARHPWCFVSGCDLPGLDTRFVRFLLDLAQTMPPEVQAVVPTRTNQQPEPLLACYHNSFSSAAIEAIEAGDLAVAAGLRRSKVYRLSQQDLEAEGFEMKRLSWNINRPEDLASFEE